MLEGLVEMTSNEAITAMLWRSIGLCFMLVTLGLTVRWLQHATLRGSAAPVGTRAGHVGPNGLVLKAEGMRDLPGGHAGRAAHFGGAAPSEVETD